MNETQKKLKELLQPYKKQEPENEKPECFSLKQAAQKLNVGRQFLIDFLKEKLIFDHTGKPFLEYSQFFYIDSNKYHSVRITKKGFLWIKKKHEDEIRGNNLDRVFINKVKDLCRSETIQLIKNGEIEIQNRCQICGKEKPEVHHWDYLRPRIISFFCKECHEKKHIDLILNDKLQYV